MKKNWGGWTEVEESGGEGGQYAVCQPKQRTTIIMLPNQTPSPRP